jgi:hypothetical protein
LTSKATYCVRARYSHVTQAFDDGAAIRGVRWPRIESANIPAAPVGMRHRFKRGTAKSGQGGKGTKVKSRRQDRDRFVESAEERQKGAQEKIILKAPKSGPVLYLDSFM